jgi:hypothetical protein
MSELLDSLERTVRNMLYFKYIGLGPPPASGMLGPLGDVTRGGS